MALIASTTAASKIRNPAEAMPVIELAIRLVPCSVKVDPRSPTPVFCSSDFNCWAPACTCCSNCLNWLDRCEPNSQIVNPMSAMMAKVATPRLIDSDRRVQPEIQSASMRSRMAVRITPNASSSASRICHMTNASTATDTQISAASKCWRVDFQFMLYRERVRTSLGGIAWFNGSRLQFVPWRAISPPQ